MSTELTKERLAEAVSTMAQGPTAIINEGDKLTIISQHDIIVCLVESIRPRQPETCNCEEDVKGAACCRSYPEAVAAVEAEIEVQMQEVMTRNGKS